VSGIYTVKNVLSNNVIAVPGNLTTANTAVVQYPGNNEANQKFTLSNTGNGEFKIEPMHAAGYGMALGLNSGKQLILDTDSNTAGKRWYVENISGDSYRVVNKAYPTEYLSVNGNTFSGAGIYSSSNMNGSVWRFTPVERNVSIRVIYEDSFYDTASLSFDDVTGRANYLFDTAVKLYMKRWGLKLNRTTERSAEAFTAYTCPLGLHTPCDGDCAKFADTCEIDLCRHKCALTFFNEVKNKYPIGSYDLLTAFHSFQALCASGYGERPGTYSTVCYYPGDVFYTIRVIQHEFSHNFGTTHNEPETPCAPDEDCIMNGGFNDINDFNLDTIWCSNCEKDFLKNKFQ
jgi:hypothetical protein